MNRVQISLKQLKENGGKLKEFKFLSKVSDYVTKNYGDIVDILDQNNYGEILEEISNKGKVTFAHYNKVDSLRLTAIGSTVSYVERSYASEDKKVPLFDQMYAQFNSFTDTDKWEEGNGYRASGCVDFKDLYYVSDAKGLTDYLESLKAEAHTVHLEYLEKKEVERLDLQKTDRELREKYGLNVNDSLETARQLELLDSEDPKERLKAFASVNSNKDPMPNKVRSRSSYNEMREIAREEARDIMEEHEDDYCH